MMAGEGIQMAQGEADARSDRGGLQELAGAEGTLREASPPQEAASELSAGGKRKGWGFPAPAAPEITILRNEPNNFPQSISLLFPVPPTRNRYHKHTEGKED